MIDWIQVLVRSLIFIIALFAIAKLLGKQQLTQLTFFEYVAGITIGNIAGEAIMGLENSMVHAFIGLSVFTLIPFAFAVLGVYSKKTRDIVEGKGTVFIKDGKVLEENMKREKYTTDELLELLRDKDVFSVDQVEFAVLEAKGSLSVLLKKEHRPITLNDLGITSPNEKETQTVVMDGRILNEPLTAAGKNQGWLHNELTKLGVAIENVFLGQVDSYGQLTVDLYDDKIQVPAPQEKPLLLAKMKKVQADLEMFALATDSDEAQKMFAKNAEKLNDSLEKLRPILKS